MKAKKLRTVQFFFANEKSRSLWYHQMRCDKEENCFVVERDGSDSKYIIPREHVMLIRIFEGKVSINEG